MKLPLAQIHELEQLEAQAVAKLAEAATLRAEFIANLETSRQKRAEAEASAEACKRIAQSFADAEDNALTQLAGLEEIARGFRNALSTTRTALRNEQNPNHEQ